MGSEVGESSSISAVSAVAGTATSNGEDGAAGVVRTMGAEGCFFDFLAAGHHGQE